MSRDIFAAILCRGFTFGANSFQIFNSIFIPLNCRSAETSTLNCRALNFHALNCRGAELVRA